MNNDWFHEYFINELKAIGRKPTSNMQHEVVDSLPSSGNEQTIYFVKNDSSSSNNHYDEYVWISSSSTFEKIGSAQIDGSTANPDWNQNDETAADYVKNRPFYIADEAYIGTLGFTATSNNTMDYTYTGVDGEIFGYFQKLQNAGEVIKVKIGTRSGLMSSTFDRGRFDFSGILSGSMAWRTGEIWTAAINDENITLVNGNAYNVVFYDITTPGHIPIDVEFLPSSVYTDSNAPVKHGSGDTSVIEGHNTTASGNFSHAEGSSTTASGSSSHAEGSGTTASGSSSHAEGSGTTASGNFSHAEGNNTTASGNFSHAEGNNTKASSHWQHVQGKYNVEDTAATYAHIVGNGNNSTRSNAHTLDWDGNAWFASDVYVGSTSGINKDEGSQKLATETYVDSMINNALSAIGIAEEGAY